MTLSYSEPIDIATHCAAISCLGNTWPDCWAGMLQGRRPFVAGHSVIDGWPDGPRIAAITDWERFGEAPDFVDRFSMLSSCIALDMKPAVEALATRVPRQRISVIIASSAGDPGCLSGLVDAQFGPGGSAVTRPMLEGVLGGAWAKPVTDVLGWPASATPIFGACASTLVGINYACDRINTCLTDVVLLIALDTLSRFASVGFDHIGAAAANGCTPYARGRDGTTVGEGAIGLLLARPGLLRPAEVAGRIAGASVYCDAAHLVEPSATGVANVVNDAIGQAGLSSADITGVYWHGTGTGQNDRTEAAAARLVFGPDKSPPCTSTKGALGHSMGASAGFNVLAACASFATGVMPPVAGTTEGEFDNLDLVVGSPRRVERGAMLITALGFGGINAAAVVLPPLPTPGALQSTAEKTTTSEHPKELEAAC